MAGGKAIANLFGIGGNKVAKTTEKVVDTSVAGQKTITKTVRNAETGDILKQKTKTYKTPVISNSSNAANATKSTSKSSVAVKSTATSLGKTAIITGGVVGASYLLKDTSLFSWGNEEGLTPDETSQIAKETAEHVIVDYLDGLGLGDGGGGTAYIGGEGVYPEEYADAGAVLGNVLETVKTYAPWILCIIIVIILITLSRSPKTANGKASKKAAAVRA